MQQIRVKRPQTLKIEVNDDHEYIEVRVGDMHMAESIMGIAELFNEKSLAALTKKPSGQAGLLKAYELLNSKVRKAGDLINEAFGADACDKIFGAGVTPTPESILDFLSQMAPIIKEAVKSVPARSKYSAGRRGGV